ncbi:MAG: ArgR family transcriptional regulator [Furfurilactobacillus sp.]|jgi:transcriptional regulator of arginine metabolism|uniref:Arginine repressor n=1 Tax=Furfurilactobacillus milii TaxID=2888272 RepID=A0ABT6DBA5_9LACO|nr:MULTISPECIES: ArgR family transcriptional regulator [Furfurilactobacillus]QLE66766.1 Arginine pathway regulatory protein ArgR repressor of arg regulon [Furfurilactobacillus rossiae]MCF6160651.1 ArgR family transcriptional regulator [Furfurilactobacillus milii]MCF6162883.1 ArgR family transcriptional regulator [Furfurilactobacillus milii]MCF6420197.1 ArgR family transcriptional regulator [Furfurilactobacillus milii]MCH4010467.1 ArgR family transcriptional regulator [Furfurilactobacillus sp.]
MQKQQRQAVIVKLIESANITNQDALQKALVAQNVHVTLATLSRDLKELHIVKEPNAEGHAVYRALKTTSGVSNNRFEQRFGEVVIDFTQVEFMNVVKTTPSDGNALAALIDDMDDDAITGTLAGHDTILVISPNREAASRLHDRWAAYQH